MKTMNTKFLHLVKTTLCLFGLLAPFANLAANGQETYRPMLKDGRVWNCIEVYLGEEKNDTVTREYRIEQTSEIDGHLCYNLCLGNKQFGTYYEEGPKVFHYTANGWELLFDFSLSPGDAVPNIGGFTVDEAKTIVMKGVSRRCVCFPLTTVDGTQLCWIEGIGSSVSGPYSPNMVSGSLLSEKLLSVYDGDVCVFDADDFLTNTDVGINGANFPEGTKWTEIRLDTLKYDSWYSKVGDEWVPNFETVEYHVKGEYVEKKWDEPNRFKCVYTYSEEWSDSLTLLICEGEPGRVATSIPVFYNKELTVFPADTYQFDWTVGTMIEFMDILSSNCNCIFPPGKFDFGVIEEIKEGDFGGVKPLKYTDVNGICIIQGIGVTQWNDGECLFGPVKTYEALSFWNGWEMKARHYHSMLVHFERNGEVLYEVWPETGATNGIKSPSSAKTSAGSILYDLQGRRLPQAPQKGVYIQNGKKVAVK